MATDIHAQTHLAPVTKRGSKEEREQAIIRLGALLQELVQCQVSFIRTQQRSRSQTSLSEKRLEAFVQAMPLLIGAFEEIMELHQIKQAGGRPMHKHFGLAYRLLKERYQSTQKIYKAKELVRVVQIYLNDGKADSDENGNHAISELVARDCIHVFKISLPYENFNVSG